MDSQKALILLSGGLDSAYNLAAASREYQSLLVVFVNYGQAAYVSERRAVKALSEHYQAKVLEIELPWLGQLRKNSLTDSNQEIPEIGANELDDMARATETMKLVWVPNRNGVLVNAAAAVAEARRIGKVFVGFNREEAATFPDNSADFLVQMNRSLDFSTRNSVCVGSYSIDLDKTEIVKRAKEIEMPLELIWSCYHSGDSPCGRCEPCQRLKRALEGNA